MLVLTFPKGNVEPVVIKIRRSEQVFEYETGSKNSEAEMSDLSGSDTEDSEKIFNRSRREYLFFQRLAATKFGPQVQMSGKA